METKKDEKVDSEDTYKEKVRFRDKEKKKI